MTKNTIKHYLSHSINKAINKNTDIITKSIEKAFLHQGHILLLHITLYINIRLKLKAFPQITNNPLKPLIIINSGLDSPLKEMVKGGVIEILNFCPQ